jgi:hypothetical protein
MVRAMRLRTSLPLIAVVALLAGFMIPAIAQGGAANDNSPGKKKCQGKKGSGKAGPGKKKCSGKKGKGKGPGAAAAECANTDRCYIDVYVRQGSPTTGSICSSFDDREGFCVGSSSGSATWSQPGHYPKQGLETSFTWKGPGGPREVDYTVNADFTIVEAYIRGNVPASNSAVFNVTDAYSRVSGVHWKTVATGAAPGTVGGPLYIDYEHKTIGSYVHIFGHMVRR